MLCIEDAKEDFEVGITIEQMEYLEMNSDWTAETIRAQIGELIEKGAILIREALQKSRENKQADFEIRMCKSTSDFRDNGGGYRTIRTKIRRSTRIIIETLSQYLPCVQLEKNKQHHWTTMLAMTQTIKTATNKGSDQ